VSSNVVIDCFAGAGGLSLGLSSAGLSPRASFDITPSAVATYRANLGPHSIEADARQIDGKDLLDIAGVDGPPLLVAGGPPCQGFSRQRRGGSGDPRNELLFDFLRLVSEIGPRYFLMENVAALAGVRGADYFSAFLRGADEVGYSVEWKILDAADFGVSQRRRRLFVVGRRHDQAPSFSWPAPTTPSPRWKSVRDAIGDLPSPIDEPTAASAVPNHELGNISELNIERIRHVPPGGGRSDIPVGLRLKCHAVSVERAGHRGVYGRLSWDEPSGTITTKCNSFTRGRFAHPSEHRNITMREAARLQGFPDDFEFRGSRVDVAHQVGNAVPPPLAAALGKAILAAAAASASGLPLAA